jgi:hypothetical protein
MIRNKFSVYGYLYMVDGYRVIIEKTTVLRVIELLRFGIFIRLRSTALIYVGYEGNTFSILFYEVYVVDLVI